jgi:hypothetical protein
MLKWTAFHDFCVVSTASHCEKMSSRTSRVVWWIQWHCGMRLWVPWYSLESTLPPVSHIVFHSLTTDVMVILIYLLTAIGLTPGGSSIVHIYKQTILRTTQLTSLFGRLSGIRTQSGQTKINDELTTEKLWPNWEKCGQCPIFANYTLAFALQLRKNAEKPQSR